MASPVPEPLVGVIPVTEARVHEYVGAGLVLLLSILYVFDTLLHQLRVASLVTTEVGLTVTETSFVVPAHPLTVGVMR